MDLETRLGRVLSPDRVSTRELDRVAWANDASVYRLVPRAVVMPRSVDEVRGLFGTARETGLPLTFRAAGTSLSGQAVTDGILVVLSRHWREFEVLNDGGRVRVQPGAIGGQVNARLRPHGVKLGPDPASIQSCMMGGILANNSSGMCCGVSQNAYHTLDSMVFVLPDGTRIDSGDEDADARLHAEAGPIAAGLLELKRRVEANAELSRSIRRKYGMKNTMGYSLNAFLDHDRAVDILTRLMIGSEGTLGFIVEAVLRTVPDHPCKSTGLLFFPDVRSACAAIAPLRESGARALELMDRASLRAIEGQPGVPDTLERLPASAAAVLAEYQCEDRNELQRCSIERDRVLPSLPLCHPPTFTGEPREQAALWRVRKGLIPSVGAMRRRGTSFIIEDVVFPAASLAQGVVELQQLFRSHGYDDAIVFGHAKDGNLHFVLTQAFDDPADVDRYDAFMRELAGLVAVRHGGALKAEHGTGRNMAPFVATEWGRDAHRIMAELKRLIDPGGILNPGVILNDDPRAHVKHLKELPTVEPEVDQCIECGFCERMCPSRDLTLTPRQRIVVRREMARLRSRDPASPVLRRLDADYDFEAVESCAADGMCSLACPVEIDTGRLIRRLRREARSETTQELAAILARRFGLLEIAARGGLAVAALARSLLGTRSGLPADLPGPAPPRTAAGTDAVDARAVLLPTCVTRIVGPADDESDPTRALLRVSQRAGSPVRTLDTRGLCCGMPFASKGFARAAAGAAERLIARLWAGSARGALPVVVDSSPCAHTLRSCGPELDPRARARLERMVLLDGIEWAERLLPGLALRPLPGAALLHPVCSVHRMGLDGALLRVGSRCAETAEIPLASGCCGFAGDRGFALPSLTEAATRGVAAEVAGRDWIGGYSTSRTCEIGMARATGLRWRSIWTLLERASEPPTTLPAGSGAASASGD